MVVPVNRVVGWILGSGISMICDFSGVLCCSLVDNHVSEGCQLMLVELTLGSIQF